MLQGSLDYNCGTAAAGAAFKPLHAAGVTAEVLRCPQRQRAHLWCHVVHSVQTDLVFDCVNQRAIPNTRYCHIECIRVLGNSARAMVSCMAGFLCKMS